MTVFAVVAILLLTVNVLTVTVVILARRETARETAASLHALAESTMLLREFVFDIYERISTDPELLRSIEVGRLRVAGIRTNCATCRKEWFTALCPRCLPHAVKVDRALAARLAGETWKES